MDTNTYTYYIHRYIGKYSNILLHFLVVLVSYRFSGIGFVSVCLSVRFRMRKATIKCKAVNTGNRHEYPFHRHKCKILGISTKTKSS